MKFKIDWERVKRTAIQSASGAGVALITAISANFSTPAIIAAVTEFVCTVAVAVLMNINKQVSDEEEK